MELPPFDTAGLFDSYPVDERWRHPHEHMTEFIRGVLMQQMRCNAVQTDSEDCATAWVYARWLSRPGALNGRFELVVVMRCYIAGWVLHMLEVAAEALVTEHERFRAMTTLMRWMFFDVDDFLYMLGGVSFGTRAEIFFRGAVICRVATLRRGFRALYFRCYRRAFAPGGRAFCRELSVWGSLAEEVADVRAMKA